MTEHGRDVSSLASTKLVLATADFATQFRVDYLKKLDPLESEYLSNLMIHAVHPLSLDSDISINVEINFRRPLETSRNLEQVAWALGDNRSAHVELANKVLFDTSASISAGIVKYRDADSIQKVGAKIYQSASELEEVSPPSRSLLRRLSEQFSYIVRDFAEAISRFRADSQGEEMRRLWIS